MRQLAQKGTEFPRSKDRGLIEASRRRGTALASTEFPRSKDRGLIEATGVRARGWFTPARFRDRKIAASLKHIVTAGKHTANRVFPRSKDRGLIEAGRGARGRIKGTGFRDRKIAASLKRARCSPVIPPTSCFRDRKIAASLKRVHAAALPEGNRVSAIERSRPH